MPNHVKNQISFKGDPEEIRKLLEWVKNDEFGMGTIDFDKIIPMPEGMSREPLSYQSRILSGGWNWYDWSVEHWGTKWNAYGFAEDRDDCQNEKLVFLTAWSAPHPVIREIAVQFPELEIVHEWADEDIGMNCGRNRYSDYECYPESLSEVDKMEFAAKLWDIASGETEDDIVLQE